MKNKAIILTTLSLLFTQPSFALDLDAREMFQIASITSAAVGITAGPFEGGPSFVAAFAVSAPVWLTAWAYYNYQLKHENRDQFYLLQEESKQYLTEGAAPDELMLLQEQYEEAKVFLKKNNLPTDGTLRDFSMVVMLVAAHQQ